MATGRPSEYSDDIARDICALLSSGKPLTKICKIDDKPGLTTVYRWLQEREAFREMYARAREDQADTLADEIVEISDDGTNDTYPGANGLMVNQDVINRSRLRVDARKWIAAKLKPRKYGERVEQHHTGGVTLNVTPKDTSVF